MNDDDLKEYIIQMWVQMTSQDRQYVAVWDYSEDGEVCWLIAICYYYSAYPIITLPWEN